MIQGRADSINRFSFLNKQSSDVYLLTWDVEREGYPFLPGSSWSEGRNYLLDKAKVSGDYDYFIFCDEDVQFLEGGFELFEKMLLKHKPSLGMPVHPKTMSFQNLLKKFSIRVKECQVAWFIDEQIQAFSRDVVTDDIALPYITKFDKVSWFYNSEIQHYILKYFYGKSIIQFNNVVVKNEGHTDYLKEFDKYYISREIDNLFSNNVFSVKWYELHLRKNIVYRIIAYRITLLEIIAYLAKCESSFSAIKSNKFKNFDFKRFFDFYREYVGHRI